jgi:hypothetical protein
MKRRVALSIFLVATVFTAVCQDRFIEKKDLKADWQMFSGDSYSAYNERESVKTIYFSVNARSYKGDYLVVTSDLPFSIMVNGKLIQDQSLNTALLIDSLSKVVSTSALFFAVHQDTDIARSELQTSVRRKELVNTAEQAESFSLKKETFFRDFVITIVLIMFIFLISTARLNPRLSSDYFSIPKIFSLRETDDDDQLYNRLTSGNILFYLFTSIVLAFFIMVISQFKGIGVSINTEGYFTSLLTWLKLSAIIFGFLFAKMIIIFLAASLFGVRDISGFHFFNFTRLLLVSIGILSLVIAVYYILHGQQKGFYFFLYEFLLWVLGGWIILLFMKLTNRVQRSVFHLFSYICATEIIPFLLIVKVLNE